MAINHTLPPIWQVNNAWREIFARVFAGMETRYNITPDWLVNPGTKRRLKLDMHFPAIGVAVRLEGLQGKQRKQRLSLEEEVQYKARGNARLEVCRAHGIELIVVELNADDPKPIFRQLDAALGRAKVQIKADDLLRKIYQARSTAAKIAQQVTRPADLKLYADLWLDRQYRLAEPAPLPAAPAKLPVFTPGMAVEHTAFGRGVVTIVTPGDDDTFLTVDFVTAGQKTLAASLVADKLHPC